MEQIPPHEQRRRPDRSSIVRLSVLKRIAAAGIALGGLAELAADNDPHPAPAPTVKMQTIDDVLYHCRSALGDVRIDERMAPPEEGDLPPDPGLAPFGMIRAASGKLWGKCKALCARPADTATEIKDDVCDSVRYVRDYRMSEEDMNAVDPSRIDCNDRAEVTCERLSRIGLPMYLLSIWPEDPRCRFDHAWHQMAACKLADDTFLIFDDQHVTLWHGSLDVFARQYASTVTMRLVPRVGISAFAEPKYDNGVSKLLVQAKHSVSEGDMQSLDLHERRQIIQIVSR